MKLVLSRYESHEKSTLGSLSANGSFQCWTLEDPVREVENVPVEQWKIKGQTAIPRGTYKIVLDFSNRFGKVLPRLLDVPGFTGIRIHAGNTSGDTEGCILVGGKPISDNFIPHSRSTFEKLFSMLETCEEHGEMITIEVK